MRQNSVQTSAVKNRSKFSAFGDSTTLTADSTYDMFSKVDSKYKRELDPVKIEKMLSREDHKTLYSLEQQMPKNPFQRALDRYGYVLDSTEKDINIPEVRNKMSPKRPDRCIIGFESILPRQYRQSIYSQNDGIKESFIVDKEKALIGRDTT
jgi:hypothetical protein